MASQDYNSRGHRWHCAINPISRTGGYARTWRSFSFQIVCDCLLAQGRTSIVGCGEWVDIDMKCLAFGCGAFFALTLATVVHAQPALGNNSDGQPKNELGLPQSQSGPAPQADSPPAISPPSPAPPDQSAPQAAPPLPSEPPAAEQSAPAPAPLIEPTPPAERRRPPQKPGPRRVRTKKKSISRSCLFFPLK